MDLVSIESPPAAGPALDLTAPFTPAIAARAGIGRAALDRLVRNGQVVRLVRGVYVDAGADLTSITRARALALVLGRSHLVVDRTAAWVHGAPALAAEGQPLPLDVLSRRRYPGGTASVPPGDVTVLGGVRCTSPVRTALDLACHLAPERALPLMDSLIRVGALTHADLVARVVRTADLPGPSWAPELCAIADGRALSLAESVLRLYWYGAQLPTPTPGWMVRGARVALALPSHRFGVVLNGALTRSQHDTVHRAGWRVLVLDERRIRHGDPDGVASHLEREFHRHLLAEMGAHASKP